MNGSKSVVANFTINTHTLTTSVTGSGSISKNPNATTFNHGTMVTLTATPSAGYSFTGWDGECSDELETCSLVMDRDKSVRANFRPDCSPANIITFEDSGSQGTVITNQFQTSHGVTFSVPAGHALPILGRRNSTSPIAWGCDTCSGSASNQTNRAKDQETINIIGDYFLMLKTRQRPTLIITYDDPVSEASGNLIDHDNNETFIVTPIRADGTRLENIRWEDTRPGVGQPGQSTYDGKARQWSVKSSSAEIKQIEIVGTKHIVNFGFAFDRFSPGRICEN